MSDLSGGVERAIKPIKGFACDKRLDILQANEFYEDGFRFCLRGFYTEPTNSKDCLNQEEVASILNSGLAIIPVQHINHLDWQPSAELARFHGEQVAKNAKALAMPAGLNVWCNITKLRDDVSIQDAIIYCNHWYDAVMEQGYVPSLFVNASLPLSGTQLYRYLNFKHFCRGHHKAPPIPELGYELFRDSKVSIDENGVRIYKYSLQLNQQGIGTSWLRNIK